MYSARIKQIRTELQLSVSKFSKKINIPERTVVSYESEGRTPSLEFLVQLCRELNINPYCFLFGEGGMFTNNQETPDALGVYFENMVMQILKKNGIIK